MARILVTGADGFIGRHAVPALLLAGHEVTAVQRNAARLGPSSRFEHLRHLGLGDLMAADLGPALQGMQIVIHLAGLAHQIGRRAATDERFTAANVTVTRRLVEAARQHGITSFINLSSLAALTGNVSAQPISDASPPNPDTGYGRSKLQGETIVAGLATTGCFAISLRPPLVVGADAPGNWSSLQRLAASGLPLPFASVRARRSYISVQSLVEAIVLLCSRSWSPGVSGAYCLADPEPLALPEVVRALRLGMNLPARLVPCPTGLIATLGAATNQRRRLAGLIGPLQVEGARFSAVFGFTPSLELRQSIALSGRGFVAGRQRRQRAGE